MVYVDDILVVSENLQPTMKTLSELHQSKDGSIGKPTCYLGATIKEWRFPEDAARLDGDYHRKNMLMKPSKPLSWN